MEKKEVRVLLRHYWKQNYIAAAAQKKSDVEGEGAVNEHTAQRWFKSGNLNLEDELCLGQTRIWDSEATKEAAEQPLTSTCRLSDTLGPSRSTIHHHLTALGKIYKSCRIVPHELTAEQAQ
jgi:hypothetical protein